MCGPVLMRRRIGLERLASNNDIAGFKFATVGVIYAVLLAFAEIVVWEKFSDAETAVVQEAGASATLYRLAAGPEPESVATRAALGNYLRLAIDRDWPLMATGKESREVTQALDALYAVALRLTENGSRQPAIFGEMFKPAAPGFTLQPASSPGSYGLSCCAAQYSPWDSRSFSAPRT